VDITWLGHAAMRVRTRQAAVVMDPTDKSTGIDMGRPTGEIVTISRHHPQHDFVKGVKGDPIVIDGPGEYEVLGVQIEGIRALWPANDGEAPEPTAFYILEAEELRFAHLGGLGQPPTPRQAEWLAGVDILILPIALPGGLDAAGVARVARQVEPSLVIPVAYSGDRQAPELKAFLEAMGLEPEEPVSRLTVNKRGLGDTPRVALLECRG
jgi:L-ascorbate metabolism protein UlaG (beta-lactamase superfamily)